MPLAPLLGWNVVPGTVQQPQPPKPDILCDVAGVGPLGVELVALDASTTRQRLSHMFDTQRAWTAAMSKRNKGEQAALQADLPQAHISVQFHEMADFQTRATALYALQGFLLRNPGNTGRVNANDIGSPAGFESANIFRGGTMKGPHVTSSSAGYWSPPQVDNITKHLQTQYEADAPLELLAYATHDEPDGSIDSLDTIKAAVAQHLPCSQFRRVHVFHTGFRQHVWSSN